MRGLKVWIVLAVSLTAFASAGCGEKDLSKPSKIHYGSDVCAECRMIIQDERFAAASVSADGRFQKFDDIGCLARYEKESGAKDLRSWVHDIDSGEWIKREQAKFVHSRDLVTPMGYGFAAFAVADDAAKWAEKQAGRVIAWNELTQEEVK